MVFCSGLWIVFLRRLRLENRWTSHPEFQAILTSGNQTYASVSADDVRHALPLYESLRFANERASESWVLVDLLFSSTARQPPANLAVSSALVSTIVLLALSVAATTGFVSAGLLNRRCRFKVLVRDLKVHRIFFEQAIAAALWAAAWVYMLIWVRGLVVAFMFSTGPSPVAHQTLPHFMVFPEEWFAWLLIWVSLAILISFHISGRLINRTIDQHVSVCAKCGYPAGRLPCPECGSFVYTRERSQTFACNSTLTVKWTNREMKVAAVALVVISISTALTAIASPLYHRRLTGHASTLNVLLLRGYQFTFTSGSDAIRVAVHDPPLSRPLQASESPDTSLYVTATWSQNGVTVCATDGVVAISELWSKPQFLQLIGINVPGHCNLIAGRMTSPLSNTDLLYLQLPFTSLEKFSVGPILNIRKQE